MFSLIMAGNEEQEQKSCEEINELILIIHENDRIIYDLKQELKDITNGDN